MWARKVRRLSSGNRSRRDQRFGSRKLFDFPSDGAAGLKLAPSSCFPPAGRLDLPPAVASRAVEVKCIQSVVSGYPAPKYTPSAQRALDLAVVCQIEVVRDFHFEVVRKRGRFPRCHRKVGRGSEFTMIKWQRGLCPRPPQDFFEAWQQETTGGAHSHAFIVKAFPLCRRKMVTALETGTGALVRKPLFFWFGPRGRFLVFWVSLGAGCLPAEPGLRFPKRQRDVASG